MLNLNEAHHDLSRQASLLSNTEVLKNENFAQQLMNCILSAMNSIGILERHYTSSRLQLRVNNMNISLDRLDEAHVALLNETKAVIELCSQNLVHYLQDKDLALLQNTPTQLCEIAGAIIFLNAETGYIAIQTAAKFIQQQSESSTNIEPEQINQILDTLASADMMIDNLKYKQPVLQAMFNVALKSSENLKKIVA